MTTTLRRNVLIFHQAALGDFIVTWPIAVALARMYPQSRVIYVTPASKGALAEKVIGVESVDVEGGWHALHAEGAELGERNTKLLTGAHTVVSFVSSTGDLWERNVRAINADATLVELSTKPRGDAKPQATAHITTELVAQLRSWPAIQEATRQILRSIEQRGIAYRRAPDGSVLIHPGAGKPEKCWPVERFVELAQRLRSEQRDVRALLGEAELEKWPRDAIEAIERVATVRRPATFLDLLNEIAPASVFVGNDSGPGHLAGMIGVPTVSLFGHDPARWKPIGPRVRIVQNDSLHAITVDDVREAISASE
jgi:ADP-heptose:LPS heptosyltransferase